MMAEEEQCNQWDTESLGEDYHVISKPEMHAYADKHTQLVIGAVVRLPGVTMFVVFQNHHDSLQIVLFAHEWGGSIAHPYTAKEPFLFKVNAIKEMVMLYWNNDRKESENSVIRPRNSSLQPAPWMQKFRQASRDKRISIDYAWFVGIQKL